MKVTVTRKGAVATTLETMPPGYGEIRHSWNDSGSPDTIYAGRILFKRTDGKVFWDDNKELLPAEIRAAELVMLNEGDVITKVLESQDAPMK
jgi:hypothetical protein